MVSFLMIVFFVTIMIAAAKENKQRRIQNEDDFYKLERYYQYENDSLREIVREREKKYKETDFYRNQLAREFQKREVNIIKIQKGCGGSYFPFGAKITREKQDAAIEKETKYFLDYIENELKSGHLTQEEINDTIRHAGYWTLRVENNGRVDSRCLSDEVKEMVNERIEQKEKEHQKKIEERKRKWYK